MKRGKYERVPAATPAASRYEKMKKRSLLQSYLISLVSLCLCATMLMGTTMAWFTSEVETNNEIYVGTLKADLLYKDQSLTSADAKVFSKDIKWQPNMVETRTLTVKNEGELDFNYSLTFTKDPVSTASDEAQSSVDMLDYFTVYVKEGEVAAGESVTANTLSSDTGWKRIGTLKAIFADEKPIFEGASKDMTEDKATYTIAILMDGNAPNEIMGQKLDFNIKLVANQIGAPEKVKNQDEFKEAISNGVSNITLTTAGTYNLPTTSGSDITISGTTDTEVTVGEGVTANGSTITFDGVTIVGDDEDGDWYTTQLNGAKSVTYKNCTITGRISTYCNSTFINCTFENTFTNDYSVYCYSGKTITFDGCKFDTQCSKAIKVYNEGYTEIKVYVNNCSFTTTTANKAAVEIDSSKSTFYVYFTGTNTITGAYTKLWNSEPNEKAGTNVYIDGKAVCLSGVTQ